MEISRRRTKRSWTTGITDLLISTLTNLSGILTTGLADHLVRTHTNVSGIQTTGLADHLLHTPTSTSGMQVHQKRRVAPELVALPVEGKERVDSNSILSC
jgi:hypothetical protein